jgi:hypothetical protein
MDVEGDKRPARRGWWHDLAGPVQDRSFIVLGAVTIVGILLVAWGWVLQGSSYTPGLLMQLGCSLMLLVPLALLGFVLEGRMRRAEEQIRATAAQIDALTAVTKQRLADHQRQRDELLDAAQHDPTQGAVLVLLREAVEIGAVDSFGLRIVLPGTSQRLRFRPDGNDVFAQVEEIDGRARTSVSWHSGESAASFAGRLVSVLRDLDSYPGDGNFDPSAVLRELLETIKIGIEARSGVRGHDLGALIELPNEQWAISADGLFSLQRPYHIPAQRIIGSHENWPGYMRTQAWVDIPSFEEAYLLARQLLRASGDTPFQAKDQLGQDSSYEPTLHTDHPFGCNAARLFAGRSCRA